MARTKAAFAGGMRLSDHPGVSVIARLHRRDTADVMVRCVSVMARLRPLATREILR